MGAPGPRGLTLVGLPLPPWLVDPTKTLYGYRHGTVSRESTSYLYFVKVGSGFSRNDRKKSVVVCKIVAWKSITNRVIDYQQLYSRISAKLLVTSHIVD